MEDPRQPSSGEEHLPIETMTTESLLDAVRDGRQEAREQLVRRYLGPLTAWARGRLPGGAREIADTDDLVQVTLLRALDKVEGFESRGSGSFLAYLRRILQNQIVDQIRRARRSPDRVTPDERLGASEPSPLEHAIGRETLERYERALAALPERQQEAVIMRIELGFTHREVAEAVGCPSANAARMLVARALLQLVGDMRDG
jgi:RNA polymerase sigma-70 factor (ECF subfamily)